jgi:ferredoxin
VIEFAVIGSGPAGWAALDYLVSCGLKPTLIDIGNTDSSNFDFATPGTSSASAVAQKSRFGSKHMYSYPDSSDLTIKVEGTIPLSSALGGLSTVWGTNLQGFEWPDKDSRISSDFEESLSAIINKLPTTGSSDLLDEVYRWPVEFKSETNISKRADRILQRKLTNKEWVIGKARNATAGRTNGCISCGQCLTGCPVGVIYSTEQNVIDMQSSALIDTISGQVMRLGKSREGFWEIEILDPHTENVSTLTAKNVYLGAGSIASSIILVRSNLCDDEVFLDDTQVMYLPFLSFKDLSAKHTNFSLAQIFLETKSGLFQNNSLHISIYEHSESFRERAAKLFPKLAPLLPAFAFRRLMAGIAFLPADVSGKVQIKRTANGIEVSTVEPESLNKTVSTLFKRITPSLFQLGLLPLKIFSSSGNVGSSYHLGALKNSKGLLIGEDGQINGLTNLYLIDSCSLPKIPAGPITLGIMANSRRITKASLSV